MDVKISEVEPIVNKLIEDDIIFDVNSDDYYREAVIDSGHDIEDAQLQYIQKDDMLVLRIPYLYGGTSAEGGRLTENYIVFIKTEEGKLLMTVCYDFDNVDLPEENYEDKDNEDYSDPSTTAWFDNNSIEEFEEYLISSGF